MMRQQTWMVLHRPPRNDEHTSERLLLLVFWKGVRGWGSRKTQESLRVLKASSRNSSECSAEDPVPVCCIVCNEPKARGNENSRPAKEHPAWGGLRQHGRCPEWDAGYNTGGSCEGTRHEGPGSGPTDACWDGCLPPATCRLGIWLQLLVSAPCRCGPRWMAVMLKWRGTPRTEFSAAGLAPA